MPKVRVIDPWAVVLAVSIPLAGCSPIQLRSGDGSLDEGPPGGVLITVENRHVQDVRVYLRRASTLIPLGTLGTLERRTFDLPTVLVGHFGTLRLVADPLGSGDLYASPDIPASPGDRVEWTLEPNLDLSRYAVYPGFGI